MSVRALRSAALLILPLLFAAPARAEVSEVRIAQEFGISYLPLTVMHHEKLLEQAAAKAGIPNLKVTWAQFGAGNAMNDALLSGSLDFPSGGVGPMLTIWSKTRGHQQVRGVAALNSMPLYLVSTDPKVKTIKDFTDQDKIALPAVKVSIQAVTLEMAAAEAFGADHYNQLDALTVSMKHPDAMAALLSGHSEITAHFGSAPFQYLELQDKAAHRVLSSYDVLGGPHTFNVVWTTQKFHDDNPKVYAAFLTGDLYRGGELETLARVRRADDPRSRERLHHDAAEGDEIRRVHAQDRRHRQHAENLERALLPGVPDRGWQLR
jgi:NitT/TauT family transport system substrate-binding protein